MKLDPRARLTLILLLSTLAVLAKDVGWLLAAAGAAILTALALKLNLLYAAKRLRHFVSLLVFIALVQSLTVKGGTVLLHIGSVQLLTVRGLGFALEFVLRMGILMITALIASAAEGREMIDGLLTLRMPYELAFMSAVALRYLPVFRDEFTNRINALALRGIDIKRLPFGKKLKVYGYLLTPAVLGSMQKAEELARAMNARGFGAYKKRTMLRELKLTWRDIAVILAALVFAAAYLAVMYTFGSFLTF